MVEDLWVLLRILSHMRLPDDPGHSMHPQTHGTAARSSVPRASLFHRLYSTLAEIGSRTKECFSESDQAGVV